MAVTPWAKPNKLRKYQTGPGMLFNAEEMIVALGMQPQPVMYLMNWLLIQNMIRNRMVFKTKELKTQADTLLIAERMIPNILSLYAEKTMMKAATIKTAVMTAEMVARRVSKMSQCWVICTEVPNTANVGLGHWPTGALTVKWMKG